MENFDKLREHSQNYQDILINGEVYSKGIVLCESKYQCMKKYITITDRPFTILDIGANFGYFPLKILEDFPNAFIVMMQPYVEGQILKEICKLNTKYNDRLILLDCECHKNNMELLSRCEHFDYIICSNILHHLPEWKEIYPLIKKMCKYLIVDTPPPDDDKACGQDKIQEVYDIVNKEADSISEEKFPRHNNPTAYSHLYFYKFNDEAITTQAYMFGPYHLNKQFFHIVEDDKRIFKKEGKEYPYIHGLNLFNFVTLNGVYPPIGDILEKLHTRNIKTGYKWDNSCKDIYIPNFILNENLNLIDYEDTATDGLEFKLRGTVFAIENSTESSYIPNDNNQIENSILLLHICYTFCTPIDWKASAYLKNKEKLDLFYREKGVRIKISENKVEVTPIPHNLINYFF